MSRAATLYRISHGASHTDRYISEHRWKKPMSGNARAGAACRAMECKVEGAPSSSPASLCCTAEAVLAVRVHRAGTSAANLAADSTRQDQGLLTERCMHHPCARHSAGLVMALISDLGCLPARLDTIAETTGTIRVRAAQASIPHFPARNVRVRSDVDCFGRRF